VGINKLSALIIGVSIFFGLTSLGFLLGNAAITFKEFERSVRVKGLSEREYKANIVIWPITFSEAENDLGKLYNQLEQHTKLIRDFLNDNNIHENEISVSSPVITDKSAQQYGGARPAPFRYTAVTAVTVYSENIEGVRAVMSKLNSLGKKGIVFTGGDYQSKTEYIFSKLNEVKPEMIEEATTKAREVATKFAQDSKSKLGKIKKASQGQFSITPRDKNNPHIKKVRVVSTVEYYLSD
jgi:hypothetical protein